MDVSLVSLSAVSIALIPVVLGLVAIAKNFVDSKFAPITSLAIGILVAFVAPASTVPLTILQGVLIGLAASGLYSGAKASMTIGDGLSSN